MCPDLTPSRKTSALCDRNSSRARSGPGQAVAAPWLEGTTLFSQRDRNPSVPRSGCRRRGRRETIGGRRWKLSSYALPCENRQVDAESTGGIRRRARRCRLSADCRQRLTHTQLGVLDLHADGFAEAGDARLVIGSEAEASLITRAQAQVLVGAKLRARRVGRE